MTAWNELLASWVTDSEAQNAALWVLRKIPGSPPILQSIHILGVAAIMASIVMIDLRVLGLAVRSQKPSEMVRRLMPWMWCAVVVNVVTALPFLLAQPYRYLFNPVFGWKLAFLAPVLLLAAAQQHMLSSASAEPSSPQRRWLTRAMAAVSLLLWIGVVLAGRWIAYSDYLFWPE